MSSDSIGLPARLVGGIVGGAGTWFALQFSSLNFGHALAGGIAGGMALIGLFLGPKIWEAAVGLL